MLYEVYDIDTFVQGFQHEDYHLYKKIPLHEQVEILIHCTREIKGYDHLKKDNLKMSKLKASLSS